MYVLLLSPLLILATRTLLNVYSSTLLDFSMYLTATNFFLSGHNPFLAITPQVYPPAFLLVMIPFAMIPISLARIIWTTLSLISFFYALHLLLKRFSFKTQIFISLFSLQLFPVKFALAQGQINLFVFLGFVLLYQFSSQKKDLLAGLTLAVITILKLNPLLLIFYFLILKKYRPIFYTLGFFALLNLGLGLLTSIPLTTSFIQATFFRITTPPLGYYNQSLPALLGRLNLASLSNIFGATFLALTTFSFSKNQSQKQKYFSLFLLTILLISPITWQHYLFWTIPAFLYYFLDSDKPNHFLALVSLILINMNIANSIPFFHFQPIYSHATFGVLILYFLVLFSQEKNPPNNRGKG